MKALIFKTLASLSILGVEHNIEVIPFLGVSKTVKGPELSIDHQVIKSGDNAYYLLNPRVNASRTGALSSGLGLGVRKGVGPGLAGVHLFGDYTYLSRSHHFQVGPTLEYLHPKWDVTVNYSFPLSKPTLLGERQVQALHHVDANVFYKTPYAHVGLEPSYNVSTNQLGAVGHVSIPSRSGNFKVSIGRNARHGDHIRFGLSVPISGVYPFIHNAKVKRNIGVIHDVRHYAILKPVVSEPVPTDIPDPVVDPIFPDLPAPDAPDQEESGSWWDWLFGGSTPKEDVPKESYDLGMLNSLYDYDYSPSDYDDNTTYASSTGAYDSSPSHSHSSSVSSGSEPAADVHVEFGVDTPPYSSSDGSSGSSDSFGPGAPDLSELADSSFIEGVSSLVDSGGYSLSQDALDSFPDHGGLPSSSDGSNSSLDTVSSGTAEYDMVSSGGTTP